MKNSNVIALDCDGVLLNYADAYGKAWERAFGEVPTLQNRDAYWPMHRWGIPMLTGGQLEQFRRVFDDKFWSTIPPIVGALEACQLLIEAGCELICVTALELHNLEARKRNLEMLGFPITKVIATPNREHDESPKAQVLNELGVDAFVDDYAPYLVGVSADIHKALILRDPIGSPNVGQALSLANSTHANLLAFAHCWLEIPEDSLLSK